MWLLTGSAGCDEVPEEISPAKKSFSVEDITAALDDMIEGNEYLRENAAITTSAAPVAAKATPPAESAAGEELDALSRALQGFPGGQNE